MKIRHIQPRTKACCGAGMRMVGTAALFAIQIALFTISADGALLDRVVAFVDDRAITLTEFEAQFESTRKVSPDVSRDEVVQTMVNRTLLLREARKYRIEGASEDEVIRDFIELKVRAFIAIPESQIESFYRENRQNFSGKDFEQVRAEIEKYLSEKELNQRLRALLSELRKQAYIRVQFENPLPEQPSSPVRQGTDQR